MRSVIVPWVRERGNFFDNLKLIFVFLANSKYFFKNLNLFLTFFSFRNQFDQLARLREIFTSQLAMAEVTPVFRSGCDVGSVYSEPAYRFNTGPGSVCSEPPYRSPSPR